VKKEINLSELADLIADGPAGQDKLKKQAAAISTLQETLMLAVKRVRPYEIPVKSEDNVIRFGVIGDTQIGSMYQRLDALKLFYGRCADEGVTDIFHAGDVLDGWHVYRGQEFELHPHGRSWPEQRDMFASEVPKIDGMRTLFIVGNHDQSFKKLVGMVVGDELSRIRPDWKYIGADIGSIVLKTKAGQKFTVQLIHPGGGIKQYALSYSPQRIIEAMSGGQKPDLLCIGHYHKSFFIPSYRNIAALCVGCYQSQTPFMVQQSIAAHIGGWIVSVYLNDRRKLTNRIQAEWVGFFEEQRV
jgi:DNA polymerase II small subunit/DNA polymerase delta subunit B